MPQARARRFGLFLALALPLAVMGCQTAPYTGRSQLILLDPNEESQLGLQAFQEVKKTNKLSRDKEAVDLVQRVGGRIAKASGQSLPWEFIVIDDPNQVNAFALPGGKVAVYSGILPVTDDETGLAVVLGHEIGHVLARHGAERISRSQLTQLGVGLAATILGGQDPASQQMVGTLLGAGAQYGVELPFSREQESEADRLGLILMAKAGYDPRKAAAFWKRMSAKGGGAPPEFLSGHPSDSTRIAAIEAELPEALQYYKQR
jgi:metalloendopeptidase OMA1, mitochondrial